MPAQYDRLIDGSRLRIHFKLGVLSCNSRIVLSDILPPYIEIPRLAQAASWDARYDGGSTFRVNNKWFLNDGTP